MTFDGPEVFLLLIPLAGLVAVAAFRGRRALAAWRRALSALVRLGLAGALLFGLARPTIPQVLPRGVDLVFLLDVSDSVARVDREAALARMERLLAAAPLGSRAALVRFAGTPEILRNPVTPLELSDSSFRAGAIAVRKDSPLDPSHTDLASAIDLARSLALPDGVSHIVLATDGNVTLGRSDVIAAPSPSAREAAIFVLPCSRPDPSDAAIRSAGIPASIEPGVPFEARIVARGARERETLLRLLADGGEIGRRVIPSGAAETTVVFEKIDLAPGPHSIVAEISGDDLPENNRVEAALVVRERPRVLLVGDAASGPLAAALSAHAFDVEVAPEIPRGEDLAGLDREAAIVLLATPAAGIDETQAVRLRRYVADFGGGLLVFGGPRESRLEALRSAPPAFSEMLPVEVLEEPPEPKPEPPPEPPATPPKPDEPPKPTPKMKPVKKRIIGSTLALVLAVDKSGSMIGEKMELVKQAAIASAMALDPQDYVAVLAFDGDPHWVLPLTEAGERGRIVAAIERLQASGETRFVPALEAARDALLQIPVRIRHVILLTDGHSQEIYDFRRLAADMAADRITLSTIGIGKDFDPKLLGELAEFGGGRMDYTYDIKHIPQTFVTEVGKVVGEAQKAREDEAKRLEKEDEEADFEQKAPEAPVVKADPPKPEKTDEKKPPDEPKKPTSPKAIRISERSVVLRGVRPETIPPVARLNPTRPKLSSTVALETVDATPQPLLAHWSFGLGRVAVFASDAGEEAAPGWPAWEDYPKLFGQILRYLRRVPESVAVARNLAPREPADEARRSSANRPLLEAMAVATGGAVDPPDEVILAGAGTVMSREPFGFAWLLIALALLPLDVAIRRLGT